MDTGFAETKVEIVKWVAVLLSAQAALIAALVKYFGSTGGVPVLMSGERGCATLRYPQKIS